MKLASVAILFLSLVSSSVTAAVVEEVAYVTPKDSVCANAKCSDLARQFVNEYYARPHNRELHTCTAHGTCDTSVPGYLWCIMVRGCDRRKLAATGTPFEYDDDCILAGEQEDDDFRRALVEEHGVTCPCLNDVDYTVRLCDEEDEEVAVDPQEEEDSSASSNALWAAFGMAVVTTAAV